uniref:BOD1/SHG1 domain-containing protein n=1 Tax=Davidia involucrata TaxID=16924 RepID=A0A5B7BM72_DAVIN
MENGGRVQHKISADDVISKLKDDGDFDRLRLKIIRKIKENEELRNSIISMVKQSAAFNRPGAENMKPRQLSDAIHQEVGDKVTSQISDGLWEIIRSADGMKSEITDTVQSVYNKLLNPIGNEEGESSSPNGAVPLQKEADNGSITASVAEIDGTLSDTEPTEPPGFSLCHHPQNNNHEEQPKEERLLPMPHDGRTTEEQKEEPHPPQDVLEPDNVDPSLPPGFSAVTEPKQSCDGSDEDPDVPPGFG